MNFDFSDEQKLFQEQVRKALAAACPLSEVRSVLECSAPYSRVAWEYLRDLGAPGAAIPERFGGLGLSYYELCLAAWEVGRALAPVPLTGCYYLAAEALMAFGDERQQAAWLPGLASGEQLVAFCGRNPENRLQYAGGLLGGACAPAWDAMDAAAAVVWAAGDSGGGFFLVDLRQDGAARRPLASVDPSRDVSELAFSAARCERLGESVDEAAAQALLARAAVMVAFEQIGGAERALEMARDYALQRRAFGRVIGSYQAIKHKLANVYIRIEIAKAHAFYAAWALSTGASDLPLAAAAARVAAGEAFTLAAQENLQTHGGVGYAWEADCQLFYRRARLTALELGDWPVWKEAVMRQLEQKNAA